MQLYFLLTVWFMRRCRWRFINARVFLTSKDRRNFASIQQSAIYIFKLVQWSHSMTGQNKPVLSLQNLKPFPNTLNSQTRDILVFQNMKDDNRFWHKRKTLKNCQFKIFRNLFLALKIIYLNHSSFLDLKKENNFKPLVCYTLPARSTLMRSGDYSQHC